MANSTANLISIRRRVKAFVGAQKRNPDRYRILAEGDSWFTTPVEGWEGPTLIDSLKRHTENRRRPFNVLSVANPTTELRNTIVNDNIDFALATFADWLGNQSYDLVLLSTGGNDILGVEMRQLLRDPTEDADVARCLADATTPQAVARCVVNCAAYRERLSVMAERFGRFRGDVLKPSGLSKARVLIHGYDYPIPDGRRMEVLGGLIKLGPWLKPAFDARHIPEEARQPALKLLIDEFNAMLRQVALSQRLFHYVDLRGTLAGAEDWADEIHPHKNTGVRKISGRLQSAIKQIRDGRAGSIIEGDATLDEFSC